MNTLLIGKKAEQKAFYFLRRHGLKPITRNYRCRTGEIDLIMRDHQAIVFVEVRLRKQALYGHSVETVGYQKQQRLIRAAEYFLLQHLQYRHLNSRFDVIGLDEKGKITWIKNAFTVQY